MRMGKPCDLVFTTKIVAVLTFLSTGRKKSVFLYTFALLRGIDLKDTSRVCVQRLRMGADSLPVWQLGVLRADKEGRTRRIRIHGQTGEVLSDTLLSAVVSHRH